MDKWKVITIVGVGLSAYLLQNYLFSYEVLLVILGLIVGFTSALVLHDNKYVAILAHIISSKLSRLTDASSLYDNDNIPLNMTLTTMWFNVGYWKHIDQTTSHGTSNAFIHACEAMTSLLCSAVGLSDGDSILDVGCGSGEQDIYIWERFKKSRIVAIEISPNQVKYAKTKAATMGIPDRIQFEVGKAEDLVGVICRREVNEYLQLRQPPPSPPPPPSTSSPFDVVMALDCAYHFRFRTNFLQQAHQVLRPGGRIGLADVCLADGVDMGHLNPLYRFGLKWMLRRMTIPPENLTDMRTYKQKLEECGFENVTVTPITDDVFPGLLRFTEDVDLLFGHVVKTYRLNKLRSVTSFLRKMISRRLLEYVIVSGVKIDQ